MTPSHPSPSRPAPPQERLPGESWEHYALYQNVRTAIATLPAYFRTETHIAGVMATDLHTLNTVLGAAIEEQAALTLNAMRGIWDPDKRYALYSFIRQAQTFPDVLLRDPSSGDILLGIELKGWYLLAKESEPSFRFYATPAVCNLQDLLVVVPWALANVISGSPIVFDPYVKSARYAAEYRNFWWQHLRETVSDPTVIATGHTGAYPKKSDPISDRARVDDGGNFGRFARTGVMDEYLREVKSRLLCGVRIDYWRMFLKAIQDQTDEDAVRRKLASVARRVVRSRRIEESSRGPILAILAELQRLAGLPEGD